MFFLSRFLSRWFDAGCSDSAFCLLGRVKTKSSCFGYESFGARVWSVVIVATRFVSSSVEDERLEL